MSPSVFGTVSPGSRFGPRIAFWVEGGAAMFDKHKAEKAAREYQEALTNWTAQRDGYAHMLEVVKGFNGTATNEIVLTAARGSSTRSRTPPWSKSARVRVTTREARPGCRSLLGPSTVVLCATGWAPNGACQRF
jgi:hypothetical protein